MNYIIIRSIRLLFQSKYVFTDFKNLIISTYFLAIINFFLIKGE